MNITIPFKLDKFSPLNDQTDYYYYVEGEPDDDYRPLMCADGLRERFMVPKGAKKVWLEVRDEPFFGSDMFKLTPKGDAVFGSCKSERTYILWALLQWAHRVHKVHPNTWYYVKVWYK